MLPEEFARPTASTMPPCPAPVMAATFFDSLSPDAWTAIFRFFSTRPKPSNWKSYVRMENFYELYCGKGGLSEMCRANVTELVVDGSHNGSYKTSENAFILRPGSSRASSDSDRAEKEIRMIQKCGRHVAKLLAYPSLFPDMQKYFLHLKELEIASDKADLASILKGLSGQLRSLYLRFAPSREQINAIAMHCQKLRRLEKDFGDYDFQQLFEFVGPGLEHIAIVPRYDIRFSECLVYIEKHCRNLTSLEMEFNDSISERATNLMVSYSANLKAARLSALSLKQYKEIAVKCPVVDCTVNCVISESDDAMMGLEDRPVCLNILAWDILFYMEGEIVEE